MENNMGAIAHAHPRLSIIIALPLLAVLSIGLISQKIGIAINREYPSSLAIPRSNRATNHSRTLNGKLVKHLNLESAQSNKFRRCYKKRFHGYWDASTNSMRSFDPVCDARLQTLVQEPYMPNPFAESMMQGDHTASTLFDQLEGSCILLLGDSTDRQITEQWCDRWMQDDISQKRKRTELWMPENFHRVKKVKDNGGLRCSPKGMFTFGSYMHYGVSGPPYWKFAHMYQDNLPPGLNWGNTTEDRVALDVPKFFAACDARQHMRKVVVVQSYLWDLARQWHVYGTERAPPRMIHEWAYNATRLVDQVRHAVPNAVVAWRYAGPVSPANGRDAQAMYDMNQAIEARDMENKADFSADYGSILSSSLATIQNKGPFNAHPEPVPRTAYLNLLLNAVVDLRETPDVAR